MRPPIFVLIMGGIFGAFGLGLLKNPLLFQQLSNWGNRLWGMRLVIENEVRYKRFVKIFGLMYFAIGMMMCFIYFKVK